MKLPAGITIISGQALQSRNVLPEAGSAVAAVDDTANHAKHAKGT